jgi:hypothetical protein
MRQAFLKENAAAQTTSLLSSSSDANTTTPSESPVVKTTKTQFQPPYKVGQHFWLQHTMRIRMHVYNTFMEHARINPDLMVVLEELNRSYLANPWSGKKKNAPPTEKTLDILKKLASHEYKQTGAHLLDVWKEIIEQFEREKDTKEKKLFWSMEHMFLNDGFLPTDKLTIGQRSAILYAFCSCFLYVDANPERDHLGRDIINPKRPQSVLEDFAITSGGGNPMSYWTGYDGTIFPTTEDSPELSDSLPSKLVSNTVS